MTMPNIESMPPEDVLGLANAMAVRAGKTSELTLEILAGLKHEPYISKTPEELRNAHIGQTAFFLARIEDPDMPTSMGELAHAAQANGGYAKMADDINADKDPLDSGIEADALRDFMWAANEEVQSEAGITNEELAESFSRTLEAASQLAEERGISIAEVYETDDLYFDAVSRAFPVEETADDLARTLRGMSDDMLNKLIVQQIESIMPKEIFDEISEEELALLVAEMQLDPSLQAVLREQMGYMQEAVRQTGAYIIAKAYGKDAMDTLPAECRDIIKPQRVIVPAVAVVVI